jgi:hypothetical protein
MQHDCEEQENDDLLRAFQVCIPELDCHDLYKELLKPTEEEEQLLREAEQLYMIGTRLLPPPEPLPEDLTTPTSTAATLAIESPSQPSSQQLQQENVTKADSAVSASQPNRKKRRRDSSATSDSLPDSLADKGPEQKKIKLDSSDKKKKSSSDRKRTGDGKEPISTAATDKKANKKESNKDKKELKSALKRSSHETAAKTPSSTNPSATAAASAAKDATWKPHEDAALLQAVEILGDSNWGAIKDALSTYQYPTSTPRTQEQCKTRHAQLVQTGAATKESAKPMSQLAADARKQNLNKMWNVWYKNTKKQKKNVEKARKKKKLKSGLMPSVKHYLTPGEHLENLNKLATMASTTTNSGSSNTTGSGTTGAVSQGTTTTLLGPGSNTTPISETLNLNKMPPRFKSAPQQGTGRQSTVPSTTSVVTSTGVNPSSNTSSSNNNAAGGTQIRRTKKPQPSSTTATPTTNILSGGAHSPQPLGNPLLANLSQTGQMSNSTAMGSFTSLLQGGPQTTTSVPLLNNSGTTQFQRTTTAGTTQMPISFMPTTNPLTGFVQQPTTNPTMFDILPQQRATTGGGVFTNLMTAGTTQQQQSAANPTNYFSFAQVVIDKFKQSTNEVNGVVQNPALTESQKLTALLQIHQRYAVMMQPTQSQHGSAFFPTGFAFAGNNPTTSTLLLPQQQQLQRSTPSPASQNNNK